LPRTKPEDAKCTRSFAILHSVDDKLQDLVRIQGTNVSVLLRSVVDIVCDDRLRYFVRHHGSEVEGLLRMFVDDGIARHWARDAYRSKIAPLEVKVLQGKASPDEIVQHRALVAAFEKRFPSPERPDPEEAKREVEAILQLRAPGPDAGGT
jgi:hypothetical protein